MKENKEEKNKYKKYWRFILKSRFDLDASKWEKFRCFKYLMTEIDVVDYLLDKDNVLKNHIIYIKIFYIIYNTGIMYEKFNEIINNKYEDISKEINSTLNT